MHPQIRPSKRFIQFATKMLLVLIYSLIGFINYAQNNPDASVNKELIKTPIPPAPNATALGKFGDIPISLSTGIPSISIPFFSYSNANKKLNLPVGLSYHAGGHRVEDIASNVGLGWALNAGGVVSRTVRGLPDEHYYGYWNTPSLPDINTNFTHATLLSYSFPQETHFLISEGITYYNNVAAWNKAKDILNRQMDGEADLFNFNAGNLSGKFFIDKVGTVHLFTLSNVSIAKTGTGFQIVDRNTSVRYYFEVPEYMYVSPNDNAFDDLYYIGSWYLSKVVSADDKETINLSYGSPGTLFYEGGFSSSYQVRYWGFNKTSESFNQSSVNTTVSAVRIQSISFPDNTTVTFSYNFNRADYAGDQALTSVNILNNDYEKHFTLSYGYFINTCYGNCGNTYYPNDESKRLKLTQVQENDGTSSLPPYTFVYNVTQLPSRNSGLKDSWGYYNAGGGTDVPPSTTVSNELSFYAGRETITMFAQAEAVEQYAKACILEQLNYPTGGYTKFTYAINDGFSDDYNTSARRHQLFFNQTEAESNKPLDLSSRNSSESVKFYIAIRPVSPQPPPNGPLDPFSTLTFTVSSTDNTVSYTSSLEYDWTVKAIVADWNLPVGKIYQIKFERDFYNSETYSINVDYKYGIPPINRTIGGLRVQKTEDFEGSLLAPVVSNYSYQREDGKSSGVLQNIPVYDMYKTYLRQWSDPTTDQICWNEINFNQSSQPSQTLSNIQGSPVTYSRVKVDKSTGSLSNGYSVHEFTTSGNSVVVEGGIYPFVQKQDLDWKLGLPAKEYYYDDHDVLLRKIENEYHVDEALSNDDASRQWLVCLIFRENYNGPLINTYNARTYYLWSGHAEITKKTEKIYNGTETVVTTTEYEYDANKYLLTKQREKTSTDNWKETRIYYPHNYSSNALPYTVAQDNGDAEIVSQENWIQKGTTWYMTSALVNEFDLFDGVVRKKIINKTELSEPLIESTIGGFNSGILKRHNSIKEQAAIRYDSKGNIQQTQKANDVKTIYLWGYNDTYPVAQVIGSDYITVSGLVDQAILRNPNSTEVQIKAQLDNLRNNLSNTKALVTTYTYKPLVGIKSQTDPNGRTTYYEYDTFGRLKLIKDQEGKILKVYDYKYRQSIQ